MAKFSRERGGNRCGEGRIMPTARREARLNSAARRARAPLSRSGRPSSQARAATARSAVARESRSALFIAEDEKLFETLGHQNFAIVLHPLPV